MTRTNNQTPSILDFMGRHFSMFDEMFGHHTAFNSKIGVPYNTTLQDESTYRVEIALAGYKKEDLEVFIEKGYLHINVNPENANPEVEREESAQRLRRIVASHNDEEPKISSYPYMIHKGITQKKLSLTFGVPKNASEFSASFVDGILTVDIKTEQRKPERLSINVK